MGTTAYQPLVLVETSELPREEWLAYCLVYEGRMTRPKTQTSSEVLERIFESYNDDLPSDYHGRSVSLSDVVERDDDVWRSYYYGDTACFVPVKFSPLLAQKGFYPDAEKRDGIE